MSLASPNKGLPYIAQVLRGEIDLSCPDVAEHHYRRWKRATFMHWQCTLYRQRYSVDPEERVLIDKAFGEALRSYPWYKKCLYFFVKLHLWLLPRRNEDQIPSGMFDMRICDDVLMAQRMDEAFALVSEAWTKHRPSRPDRLWNGISFLIPLECFRAHIMDLSNAYATAIDNEVFTFRLLGLPFEARGNLDINLCFTVLTFYSVVESFRSFIFDELGIR